MRPSICLMELLWVMGIDSSLDVGYRTNPMCRLAALCDLHGSDKGSLRESGHAYPWRPHTYAAYYSRLFSHCRPHVRRVFECGLGTNNTALPSNMGPAGRPGASLRVWRDYFPNAEIVGADIDRDILFQEPRIATWHVDQTDPASIAALWARVGGAAFDFMVDDGLHAFAAGVCLFEHSIDRLAPHGLYVVEDVTLPDLDRYAAYFASRDYVVDYVRLHGRAVPETDNNLVVVRRP